MLQTRNCGSCSTWPSLLKCLIKVGPQKGGGEGGWEVSGERGYATGFELDDGCRDTAWSACQCTSLPAFLSRVVMWSASLLLQVVRVRFQHIALIASLAGGLAQYHDSLGVGLVDCVLEDVR